MNGRAPKGGWEIWFRRAGSLRLTLWLLALLALVAALGTMNLIPQGLPPEEYGRSYGLAGKVLLVLGLDRYYQSIPVQGLFLALTVNLLCCGLGRSLTGVRDAAGRGSPSVRLAFTDRERAARALADAGFRIHTGEKLRATRRPWAFLGFPLVHLPPLLILLGAWWGTAGGAVYTKIIPVGAIAETAYDWSVRDEVALPFAVRVTAVRKEYYPHELKVQFRVAGSEATTEIQVKEGETFDLPGTQYRGVAERFDPESKLLTYFVLDGDRRLGPFVKGSEEGAPVLIRPSAFLDSPEKQVRADVSLYGADGSLLREAAISVNHPLDHEGFRVFLTAWGADGEGNPYAGFQFTRDPGQSLLWVGSVLLCAGLLLLLFGDGGWVREEGGELLVKASRRRHEALAEALGGEEDSP
jgi:cytochrome c biogenesis protein